MGRHNAVGSKSSAPKNAPVKLPIDDSRGEIEHALRDLQPGGRLVLSAPTGSGKSTRLPVWCREAALGPVLVVEPRRIACRTLAGWVAKGLGQPVGGVVGFSIRFEQRHGESTEILFVTPGVARRFLTEGTIFGYGTVIFDEFHERSWETDTVMAALAASKNSPRLVLMSATLSADRLVATYGARQVESLGRAYPVDIGYRTEGELTVPSTWNLVSRVAKAVEESWDRQGSTLVFLPGLAAMREVKQRLPRLPVCLLHGSFANREQDSAFDDHSPRIVLATNVAESSLTVPGITTVVDSGLEKRPIHQSGYVALATVPIASSSADQRAGRAGRTAPGRCLRLWDPKARLETSRPPDLERMELDDLLLFLAGLPGGLSTPLEWVDTPPAFAWERALGRLRAHGLIDEGGRATALGVTVGRLPVDSDWARILALAPPELRADLCDLHAISSGRRGLHLAQAGHDQIEQRKKDLGEDPWRRALSTMRLGEPSRHGLDREALEEARRLSADLRQALQASAPSPTSLTGLGTGTPHPQLGPFLARHWPERHFVRRQGREAWGNGLVECRTGRGEDIAEDCQAALFLQVEPVVARGLKVELKGGWPLPVTLSALRQAGYGAPELSKIRWRDGHVTARTAWVYAGRELGQEEDEVRGAALRLALYQLASRGSWKKDVWQRWEDETFYAELRQRLAGFPWDGTVETLFLEHLARLGVESSEELALLEDQDLNPSMVEPEELETLRKAYPRLYLYGGAAYDAGYDPERHLVRLTWRSGPKGARPNVQHLPRWNGWKVELDERGRVTPLR